MLTVDVVLALLECVGHDHVHNDGETVNGPREVRIPSGLVSSGDCIINIKDASADSSDW